MNRMKFSEDISLEEIYEQNKDIIYSEMINKISEVVDTGIQRVEVMELDRNGTIFTIDLNRSQFIPVLNSAIEYYANDEVQEYEKCHSCKILINRLNG